jgi:GNAT superfamily N-acetyltransferase
MEIRSADTTDLDLVLQMRLAFLGEVRGLPPTEITDDFRARTRAFLDTTQREGRLRTWIATDNGHALGIVSVIVNDTPPLPGETRCREGYVINEYVKPVARGRGVGRLLLQAALGSAETLGIRRYYLFATDAGRPLYATEGFASTDRYMTLPVPVGGRGVSQIQNR